MPQPTFLRTLDDARAAGIPGVILSANTTDRVVYPEFGPVSSLVHFIARYLTRQGHIVGYFAPSSAFTELRPPDGHHPESSPFTSIPHTRDVEQVLPLLTPILRSNRQRVAVILDYADHLVPSAQGMSALLAPQHLLALELLHSWGIDDDVKRSGNVIVLISHENQVHDLLRQGGGGYRVIQVDLPTEAERRSFIDIVTNLARQGRSGPQVQLAPDLTPDDLSRATGGLRYTDIEALFRLSSVRRIPISRPLVAERKAVAIRELGHDLLEVREPEHGFEGVAGLQHALDYLQLLKVQMLGGSESVPQGILLAGVPGSGKSFLVQALAKELDLPLLVMRNVRDRWVGASERNLELVLWIIETLAPCIVWIDEVDQMLGQRGTGASGDSGTSERMLSRIWEFQGSMRHRGRILWVSTTNRPDLLDAATLDRNPVVIPFLHPSPNEVANLLPVVAGQVGRRLSSDVDGGKVAQIPSLQMPTVRALQEVVGMAGAWSDQDKGVNAEIAHSYLEAAARDFKPNYNLLQHEFIALTAVRMASFQSLLPWRTRSGRRTNVALPPYLVNLVNDDGMLDAGRLQARLRELQPLV